MNFKSAFGAAIWLAIFSAPALADPAVVMAPGSAGGGYDAMARLPFEAMRKEGIFTDGAQFTNRGGAGGAIGLAEFVNTSKGNDNAVMSMGAILIGGIVLNNSPVTLKDVTPLVRLTNDTGAIAVPANSDIKTINDLVAKMKENLGGVAIGGGSAGGVDHIAMALLAKANGLEASKLNYIPYAGGAEVVTALAGGSTKAAISGLSEFRSLAEAGRIRIIAVTSKERVAGIDAPSLTEAGYPVVIGNWRGIVGAPGMSADAKKIWLDRFAKMHETETWKATLKKQNWEDAYLSGDDFVKFLDNEVANQTATLKDVGLTK
ncbi:Bug family tripartite tricarboxylate transporter substrate binding protein [Rhizobium mesosinicum]|uniref:Tripartite tricarboxylate transporter substrate binding protein n=1 Tax=Rhizobium mesosinicum TaxID=335017 RepID=A0ABS7GRU8_9HYPH|nr:tripartite tricarboxylate transporter substrate-binding protein [Rhizobium mesosinicum]MBW9052361.1 tripartite tricarboxylate transporter substrate binding protein [Rhizobium mesosinicum]